MGERAKVILNEYSARDLLKRDTLDLDKFYTADLKLFVEAARKEIERLNKELEFEKLKNKEVREYIESYNLPEDLGHLGEAPISIRELRDILEILDKGGEESGERY